MTDQEFILKTLTKRFNLTEDEIKTKFFTEKDKVLTLIDGADEVAFTLEAGLAKVWKDRETASHDKGYKKAQAESLGTYEKEMIAELGIDSDKKGKELHAEIKELLNKKPTGKKDEITQDDIKKSKTYIELESSINKDYVPVKKYQELEGKQKQIDKSSRFEKAKKLMMPELEKFALPEDVEKRQFQVDTVFDKIFSQVDDIEFENDSPIFLKDGKRLEHPTTFQLLKPAELATPYFSKIFEPKKADPKGNGGNNNNNNGGGGATTYKGEIPKTYDELVKMQEGQTPEIRKSIYDAYAKSIGR